MKIIGNTTILTNENNKCVKISIKVDFSENEQRLFRMGDEKIFDKELQIFEKMAKDTGFDIEENFNTEKPVFEDEEYVLFSKKKEGFDFIQTQDQLIIKLI